MNATQIKKIAVSSEQRAAAGSRAASSIQNPKSKIQNRQGFTLPEMLVTIGVVAIVAAMALPAFYAIRDGFSSSGADTLISAALSTAKAMAAKEQKYVGVRFQCLPNPDDPTKPGDQYMIFIIQDPSLSANGFRAANGIEPLKLPVNQGVMDMFVKDNYNPVGDDGVIDDPVGTGNDDIKPALDGTEPAIWDTTTFSIVFSPSGRLVTHDVRVWNNEGNLAAGNTSEDMVFNTKINVDGAIAGTPATLTETYRGMFYQDNLTVPAASTELRGLKQESSRKSFVIYDKRDLAKTPVSNRWNGYLKRLSEEEHLYINPYTGTIIENQSRRNAMK